MIVQIAQSTGWVAHTRRSPHIPSTSINTIHSTLKSSARERSDFLQKLGRRLFRGPLIVGNAGYENGGGNNRTETEVIHRPQYQQQAGGSNVGGWSSYTNKEEVTLFCLGGVKQVGRSCFLVVTPESKVMLDCGINPGEMSGLDAYPRLDWLNFNFDDLDAVVIGHAHIDHQGFLPALFKYG
ncbi:MAG: beta-CASP ribonuclease aCPSF1, partial [Nitrososphaera sp.]